MSREEDREIARRIEAEPEGLGEDFTDLSNERIRRLALGETAENLRKLFLSMETPTSDPNEEQALRLALAEAILVFKRISEGDDPTEILLGSATDRGSKDIRGFMIEQLKGQGWGDAKIARFLGAIKKDSVKKARQRHKLRD